MQCQRTSSSLANHAPQTQIAGPAGWQLRGSRLERVKGTLDKNSNPLNHKDFQTRLGANTDTLSDT
jgi:hypothetical protein